MFLRGNGGKSAVLGVEQGYGTYVPNTTITLSGQLGGDSIVYGSPLPESFANFSHVETPTYVVTRVIPYGNSTRNFNVTINSGSNETRPVNKSVRYMIRALP